MQRVKQKEREIDRYRKRAVITLKILFSLRVGQLIPHFASEFLVLNEQRGFNCHWHSHTLRECWPCHERRDNISCAVCTVALEAEDISPL